MTGKFRKIVLLSMVALIGLCLWISFQMQRTKVEKDKQQLISKIDQLFQSKNVIADGQKYHIIGDLNKRLYSLFIGGFTIYELSKESGGFVKSMITAGDIKYKEDEYRYFYGYKMPIDRQTPQECYDDAFEFLLLGNKDNRKNSYTENTYTEIKDFPMGFYSEFHFVKNVEHPTEFYIQQNGRSQVSNSSYEVICLQEKTYYTIDNDKEEIQKSLLKYLVIGLAVALALTSILFLILRFFIPSTGKWNVILNKKWKNIENNSILTLEPQLFGKSSVTIVENEKAKRGTAKFSENGTQLHISLPETELFYKIILAEENKLEVENMTTHKVVFFEKLGSNAYKKTETDQNENPLSNTENNT
jgi:hypothetical protein